MASKSKKKPATTSSPGDESRRWRETTVGRRERTLLRALREARSWVKVVARLVERRVEQIRIISKKGLRAVAVVHVDVDDRDSLDAVRRARVESRNSGIVVETKAHGSSWCGVVARRADTCKRAVIIFLS